jgi:hypothetical protein
LRAFENTVLRRIFGKEREVTRSWRNLNAEELRNLYSPLSITTVIKSRRMRCAGHVEYVEKLTDAYRILVRIPDGKRRLARKMDLKEIRR